jgi:hypothetical protein
VSSCAPYFRCNFIHSAFSVGPNGATQGTQLFQRLRRDGSILITVAKSAGNPVMGRARKTEVYTIACVSSASATKAKSGRDITDMADNLSLPIAFFLFCKIGERFCLHKRRPQNNV